MTVYRLAFLLPYVLPIVATRIIWRWMYNQRGVVNQALRLAGLDRFARAGWATSIWRRSPSG